MNVNNSIQHIPGRWYWYLVLPLIVVVILLAIWLCLCHFLPTLFTGHICSISSAQVYFERDGQFTLDTFLCADVYILLHNNHCVISYGDIDTNSSYYVL